MLQDGMLVVLEVGLHGRSVCVLDDDVPHRFAFVVDAIDSLGDRNTSLNTSYHLICY